ncbi:MAG: IS3 family transposase [Bacteroidota bacterium]|nr:IS3 family transposase [Bacteroidota bacterium]MDX5340264.1 IS3 family transposase [Cyclobacteriaceae bacterium]MDX5428873.1 IS3 family transposase [Bacteroidota bacterium]MDX5506559.1 IS3 family transposase [Bacteroidota bacterium]
MNYSLNALYRTVGISRQGVYRYGQRQRLFDHQMHALVGDVDRLRKEHPGCGVAKMYTTLKPDFIGRDRFIETFMALGYRVKRKRSYPRTTRAGGHRYPNLIEGIRVDRFGQVWQSDLTYVRVGERFYYVVFIVDVFTRTIVGHSVSDHMRTESTIRALKRALDRYGSPEIFHSDRGSQYSSREQVRVLKTHGVRISMGKIAQENAYAERINGTIKNEFLAYQRPRKLSQLKACVRRAVSYYNNKRPHDHLKDHTPLNFASLMEVTPVKKRPEMTIFKYESVNQKVVNSI